jgi:hypothetical protein
MCFLRLRPLYPPPLAIVEQLAAERLAAGLLAADRFAADRLAAARLAVDAEAAEAAARYAAAAAVGAACSAVAERTAPRSWRRWMRCWQSPIYLNTILINSKFMYMRPT